MQSQQPAGLILLSHPELVGITDREMTDSLPIHCLSLPRKIVELDVSSEARKAIATGDWHAAQRQQEAIFREQALPLMQRHSDYAVVYFGSSSVPLAIHLGSLLSTWHKIELIPHHHSRRNWGWVPHDGDTAPEIVCSGIPDYKDRTPGEAVIRISTSHPVDPLLTQQVIPSPLLQIDIGLKRPREDAFANLSEMLCVATEFRRVLDLIGDNFAGISLIHLFAAVQPGIAMLLGAQISRTMHPPIQTYQYTRQEHPPHRRALLVNAKTRAELPPLTPEQQSIAAEDRKHLARDLERIQGLSLVEKDSAQMDWLAGVRLPPDLRRLFGGSWDSGLI